MKNIVFPFIFGVALCVAGITVFMWQFWVLVPLAAVWAHWPEKQP